MIVGLGQMELQNRLTKPVKSKESKGGSNCKGLRYFTKYQKPQKMKLGKKQTKMGEINTQNHCEDQSSVGLRGAHGGEVGIRFHAQSDTSQCRARSTHLCSQQSNTATIGVHALEIHAHLGSPAPNTPEVCVPSDLSLARAHESGESFHLSYKTSIERPTPRIPSQNRRDILTH